MSVRTSCVCTYVILCPHISKSRQITFQVIIVIATGGTWNWPSGSLMTHVLYYLGPPGTGKTMLARTLASQEPQLRLLNLSASSLSSKWRGESEKLMKVAFELARENLPCLIFMDEVDAILGDRGGVGEHEASRRYDMTTYLPKPIKIKIK